jgi:hypothetical protein
MEALKFISLCKKFAGTSSLDLELNPELDPHTSQKIYPDPKPHTPVMKADTKHCYKQVTKTFRLTIHLLVKQAFKKS